MINMKKIFQGFFAFVIITIFVFSLASCAIENIFNRTDIDTNIENYETKRNEVISAKNYMPSLSELGEYENVSFGHKITNGFFKTETVSLFLEYSSESYLENKEQLLSKYQFFDSAVVDYNGNFVMPVAEIDYGGYHFQIASNDKYSPCKSFVMVGYDDVGCRLALCYFYDVELDYIAEADENPLEKMQEFIKRYFVEM